MSGLTDAERELFAAAMHDCFQGWKGDPRGTLCGACLSDAEALAPVVEQIVAARVTAALNEAADVLAAFDLYADMHRVPRHVDVPDDYESGVNDAARIVRALAPPT